MQYRSIFARVGLSRVFTVLAVATVASILMAPAQAALVGTITLAPSTFVLPPLIPNGTVSGTLLASLASPYSFSTTAGITSGTLYTAVYRETGGTLDFYYQVANNANSASAIARESD